MPLRQLKGKIMILRRKLPQRLETFTSFLCRAGAGQQDREDIRCMCVKSTQREKRAPLVALLHECGHERVQDNAKYHAPEI
jgi:hypothetical protein